MSKRGKQRAAAGRIGEPVVVAGSIPALDAFQNSLTRQGVGMPNLTNATKYPLTRMDFDFTLLNSLYRSHWIAAGIVDIPAEDMLKNWITLQSKMRPEDIDDFERRVRQTRTRAQLLEGLKWGRLYGGAIGIITLASDTDLANLSEPLELENVQMDDYRGLRILDRWMGATPSAELVDDITSPEFGMPKYYSLTGIGLNGVSVHHSRIVRFVGVKLPPIEEIAESYWGMSVLERPIEEILKRDNSSANIAGLIFRANLIVRTMADLPPLAATNNQAYQRILQSLEAQNQLLNNFSQLLLGRDETVSSQTYTFSGLADIYEEFMLDVAGAAHIPVTKLYGRSPAGMNSTGESDLQNYYDMITQEQETTLRPVLDKLLPVICMSTFGAVPDDLNYKFNSPKTVSPKEAAELAKAYTEAVASAYNANLISQKAAAKELRQQADTTGIFSNITDEDIEHTTDEYIGDRNEDMSQFADILGGLPTAPLPAAEKPESDV